MAEKNKGGRPETPEELRRSERFSILLSRDEMELVRAVANRSGLGPALFGRFVILKEARKAISE